MNTSFYLDKFHKVVDQLDKRLLKKKQIEVAVVMFGKDCVVLKLYKKSWTNEFPDSLTSESRIFFSVWISDSTIQQKKIFYNIHALKLRKLNGYSIESRKFANSFREKVKKDLHKWENVRINFGPLTLMEGHLEFDNEKVQEDILQLANNFLEIENIIDKTLVEFKK